ncbi:hypothetical protein PInf_025760 [Phytophthora infestans]|nr:hypothetical protein PInf_025760 [Phytophthora infestans]
MQYAVSRSLERSMERKNDILSEWASIEVFNMPDADPDQRAQFFKILRQKKLSEMMKKIAESKQSDDETSETYQVSAAETEIPEFDEASVFFYNALPLFSQACSTNSF